ncbi:MAG: TolC family protein [Opitutaceae bacterium]|nr:TolC family protein [Opitutaceae bacterium]
MSRPSVRATLLPRVALFALLALSRAAFAQQPQAQPVVPPPAQPQAQQPIIAPDKPLTLDEAVGWALQKNFGLQRQTLTLENAKETVISADADFDPTLTATAIRSVNQAASTTSRLEGTAQQGPRSDNTTMRVGANQRLEQTNGTVSVSANLTRQATNSTNALLNPAYGNGISANLNQPLLRNSGRLNATAVRERAKIALTISQHNYKNNVLQLIENVENAYFNVVAARETLRIRQMTQERSQLLVDENTARRTSGVATDLDVLTSEVGLANARRAVIQQEQVVHDAEDALLNLINVPTFDARLGPVAFDDYREGTPNFAQSYKLARENFPDTLSAQETIRSLEITLAVARRNLRPTLNLDASLGYTARATSANYQQTIANLPNDHGNNWNVSLNYSMPWGKRADRSAFRRANNDLGSQKIELDRLEQQLIVLVRGQVRAIETQVAAVQVQSRATELAARQFEQQKARYDAGLSTSRVVLQFQEDLENTRLQELNAKLALRRAVSELRRLEGTSIERFRVQLPY